MKPAKSQPTPEKAIQNAIIREFGTRHDMRIWRMNTGKARKGNHVVTFGVPGQADLTGILPDGRRLEIEVKTDGGRQTVEQVAYSCMISRFNGIYILARSVADVYAALQEKDYLIFPKSWDGQGENAIDPDTWTVVRCPCTYQHQPHDACDGNPGAGLFGTTRHVGNGDADDDRGKQQQSHPASYPV